MSNSPNKILTFFLKKKCSNTKISVQYISNKNAQNICSAQCEYFCDLIFPGICLLNCIRAIHTHQQHQSGRFTWSHLIDLFGQRSEDLGGDHCTSFTFILEALVSSLTPNSQIKQLRGNPILTITDFC